MSLIQKQIERLRKEAELFREPRREWPWMAELLDGAAETIEMLLEKPEKLRTASLDNGWIPVEYEMPKNDNGFCDGALVCDLSQNIIIGWYDDYDCVWRDNYDDIIYRAIAWRPLPEPYKED